MVHSDAVAGRVLAAGDRFAGHLVVSDISRGGMGHVYSAVHETTREQRALKVMLPHLVQETRFRTLFLREAEISTKLESPYIVEVRDTGIEDDTPWISMELLTGETLGSCIERRGALPFREVVFILNQVCAALDAARMHGVVHRDIKPENIYLADVDGATVAKVLDFGIARFVHEATTKGASRLNGAMVGTAQWMSPEQCEGKHADHAADIWPLGLLAFRMLTGRLFWRTGEADDATLVAFALEIVHSPLPTATERAREQGCAALLPRGFDDWFGGCVNRDPSARFQSATAAAAGLAALGAGAFADAATIPGGEATKPSRAADGVVSTGHGARDPLTEPMPTADAPTLVSDAKVTTATPATEDRTELMPLGDAPTLIDESANAPVPDAAKRLGGPPTNRNAGGRDHATRRTRVAAIVVTTSAAASLVAFLWIWGTSSAPAASPPSSASVSVATAPPVSVRASVGEAPAVSGSAVVAALTLPETQPKKCDPTEPPYFPCCDKVNSTVWADRKPDAKEFDHYHTYLLSCARTASKSEKAPPWVCGYRKRQCEEAPERAGDCNECTVYTSGVGKPATWTRMRKPGTMYGPFTPDGRKAIMPRTSP